MTWRTRKKGTPNQIGKRFFAGGKRQLPPKIAAIHPHAIVTSNHKQELEKIAEKFSKEHGIKTPKIYVLTRRTMETWPYDVSLGALSHHNSAHYASNWNAVLLGTTFSSREDLVGAFLHELGHAVRKKDLMKKFRERRAAGYKGGELREKGEEIKAQRIGGAEIEKFIEKKYVPKEKWVGRAAIEFAKKLGGDDS